jgi:hypothetical protein
MSVLPEPGCIALMSSRLQSPLMYGADRPRVCDPCAAPLTFGDIQILEGWHVYCHFHSLMHSVIAKFKGPRSSQAWPYALACSTALALLASLLWLAPWQVWHDSPATVPQSMPLQGSDHTAEETVRPTAQPVVAPTSERGALPSAPAPQSPEQPHISTTADEPTAVWDTQAMQGLATRLETNRSDSEEYLDTGAMDRLLARLASADKTASAPSQRSKAARKRGTRVPPRVGNRRAPGSVSPPRADPAPLSAASGMQFPEASR